MISLYFQILLTFTFFFLNGLDHQVLLITFTWLDFWRLLQELGVIYDRLRFCREMVPLVI